LALALRVPPQNTRTTLEKRAVEEGVEKEGVVAEDIVVPPVLLVDSYMVHTTMDKEVVTIWIATANIMA
jgi:hypothetical protein